MHKPSLWLTDLVGTQGSSLSPAIGRALSAGLSVPAEYVIFSVLLVARPIWVQPGTTQLTSAPFAQAWLHKSRTSSKALPAHQRDGLSWFRGTPLQEGCKLLAT